MKRFLFFVVAATILASCTDCDDNMQTKVVPTEDFTVTFDPQTRALFDGSSIAWNSDDVMTIFTSTAHNRKYQVKELSDDCRTATFGYVSYTGKKRGKIASNYGLYPYDAKATISGNVINTTMQSEQIYDPNNDLSYALMVAQSDNNTLYLSSAGALIGFKVSKIVPDEYTLNHIKITSSEQNIAGAASINLATDECTAVVSSSGVDEVTLNDINTSITNEAQMFYVAMPALSFANRELSVTFAFNEGDKVFELPGFNLQQGTIKTIAYTISEEEVEEDVEE